MTKTNYYQLDNQGKLILYTFLLLGVLGASIDRVILYKTQINANPMLSPEKSRVLLVFRYNRSRKFFMI